MKTAIAMREDKMAIEYIDREEYCEKHCRCSNEYCDRQSCPIWKAPAADVAPVVHGKWEYIPQTLNTLSQLRCPFCGWWSLDPSIDGAYNYCPNCGAKMDGGAKNA